MMRRGPTAVGAVLILALLAACGGEQVVIPTDRSPTSVPTGAESPFAQAASRISPDALAELLIVEFGQTAQLLTLSEADPRWLSVTHLGNRLFSNKPWAVSIGVDAEAADYSIEVGALPARVGLLAGGQDPDAITQAAEQTGFTGDDVLSHQPSPSVPLTISIQQIKPLEEDVVLATAGAETGWVDGGSLFADEGVGPIAVCLGDVLAALITELNGAVVGVGVRAEDAEIVSVICVPGGEDAIEDAEKDLAGPDFVDRLELVDSEVLDDLARITVQHATDAPPGVLFSALEQRDLPGG